LRGNPASTQNTDERWRAEGVDATKEATKSARTRASSGGRSPAALRDRDASPSSQGHPLLVQPQTIRRRDRDPDAESRRRERARRTGPEQPPPSCRSRYVETDAQTPAATADCVDRDPKRARSATESLETPRPGTPTTASTRGTARSAGDSGCGLRVSVRSHRACCPHALSSCRYLLSSR
jgi:hypothetical protein